MSLDPGKLRHRVAIQQVLSFEDSNGDTVEEWATVAEVWAAIEPLSARDFMASRSEQSQITARITIRYRTDIRPHMRVLHRTSIYHIEGVLPDKDSGLEYLTLPCSAGVRDVGDVEEDLIIDGGGSPL